MGQPPGPPPVDFEKGAGTAVLDGKRKEKTQLKLAKGRNVLICFLTDRDGKGKSHDRAGDDRGGQRPVAAAAARDPGVRVPSGPRRPSPSVPSAS